MIKVLVDTDVLVDLIRGNDKAVQLLNHYYKQYELCVSSITRHELLIGGRSRQETRDLLELLALLKTLPLSDEVAQTAENLIVDYSLSHNLQLVDALIAGTALKNQALLLSGYGKNFHYIKDLVLLPY